MLMKIRKRRIPAMVANAKHPVVALVSLVAFMILTIAGLYGTMSTVLAADTPPDNPLQQLKQRNIQIIEQINQSGDIQPGVNPLLAEHARKFQSRKLEKLTPDITVRMGEFSVYSFVKTSGGVVAVDTGWFINQTAATWAEYQKQIGGKPLVAIAVTHSHGDHIYGADGILDGVENVSTLPVYGPRGWERYAKYETGPMTEMFLRRALAQMGAFLPLGEIGNASSGLGAPVEMGPMGSGVAVTHEITKDMDQVRIGDKDFIFMNAPGDLQENMAVYVKQDKVLFIGDILDGTFLPYMSARWEPGRTIVGYQHSLERLMEHFPDAEHLVSGHGVVTSGKDAVRQRLQDARDLSKFTEDYLNRAAILGWSDDKMIEHFALPARLANNDKLQPFYHRLDWILRGAYVMKTGWVKDINSLTRWTDTQETRRLVALIGGPDEVMSAAQKALNENDPRWAITLTNYLLTLDSSHTDARNLQKQALMSLAYQTQAANERNYAISDVTDLPWEQLLAGIMLTKLAHLPTTEVLNRWPLLINMTAALHDHLVLGITIEQESDERSYTVTLREGVVDVFEGRQEGVVSSLTMNRDTLNKIAARAMTLTQARARGLVNVNGDNRPADRMAELMMP